MKYECENYKYIKKYRKNLQKYDVCIRCMQYILQHANLIHVLEHNVITKSGIGYEIHGFSFPNLFEPWEKDEEDYFDKGVLFFYHDDFTQIITDQEFVELIEDTCKIYLKTHLEDKQKLDMLIKQIKILFTAN